MNFLEKDLESIIWEAPLLCFERGLRESVGTSLRFRQPVLAPFGTADLVFINIENGPKVSVTIIECKRETIDVAAYQQVHRYQTALAEYLSHELGSYRSLEFRRVLVGRKLLRQTDFLHLLAHDVDTGVYEYRYDYDGIHFEEINTEEEVLNLYPDYSRIQLRGIAQVQDAINEQGRKQFGADWV